VMRRETRMRFGLPATRDVGVLAGMLTSLKSAFESQIRFHIVDAVVSVPHLLALYEDDVLDACAFAGIEFFEMWSWTSSKLVWDSTPSFGGYGIGTCRHPEDYERCNGEWRNTTKQNILTVHYSHGALKTTYLSQTSCYYSYEPGITHHENFSMGFDAPSRISEPGKYWRDVRLGLRYTIDETHIGNPEPDVVAVTGDAAGDEMFRKVLKEAVPSPRLGTHANDTVFAAAKGTAWLHMYGKYRREAEKTPNPKPMLPSFN
jgi:hypothetical protein